MQVMLYKIPDLHLNLRDHVMQTYDYIFYYFDRYMSFLREAIKIHTLKVL